MNTINSLKSDLQKLESIKAIYATIENFNYTNIQNIDLDIQICKDRIQYLESNNSYLPTIKIGKESYQTQKGDYIYDNGSTIQLVTGDNRILKYIKGDFGGCTSVRLTKKAESQIEYLKLKIVSTKSGRKWYF